MGQLYKIKQIFRFFLNWNKHREMVFFADGDLLKLNYVVLFNFSDTLKVVRNRFLYNVEEIITKHLKNQKISYIVTEREKIAKLIDDDVNELLGSPSSPIASVKLGRLVVEFNSKKDFFYTKDGKKVSVFFCFDENTISDDYLDETIEYVKNNVKNHLAENIEYVLCNTDALFPKIEICLYV